MWMVNANQALTPLGHIRRIQIATALYQAVLLNPNSIPARELLARTFDSEHCFDLAYLQATEQLRLVRRAGPGTWESPQDYENRIARIVGYVNQLEETVQAAENRYLIRTVSLSGNPLARARIAAELGLVQKAIEVLEKSQFDLFGFEGLEFLTELLLKTGQAAGARILLDTKELLKNTNVLGIKRLPGRSSGDGQRFSYLLQSYDWLDLCHKAATGHYDGAGEALDRLGERLNDEKQTVPLIQFLSRQLAMEVGSSAPPGSLTLQTIASSQRHGLHEILKLNFLRKVMRADLANIQGILELERGNTTAALERGEAAIKLYAARLAGADRDFSTHGGYLLALRYTGEIRRQSR
jgi:hypothetical protein